MVEKRKNCQPSAGEGDDKYERPIYRKSEKRHSKSARGRCGAGPQLHRHRASSAWRRARNGRARLARSARKRLRGGSCDGSHRKGRRARRAGHARAGTDAALQARHRDRRGGGKPPAPQLRRHGASAHGHTARAGEHRRASADRCRRRSQQDLYGRIHPLQRKRLPRRGAQRWRRAAHGGPPRGNEESRPVQPRSHGDGGARRAGSRDRTRQGDRARHSDPLTPVEKQPGAHRRAGRRQDRRGRGSRPARRARRGAGESARQAHRVARSHRHDRRDKIPRRL